VFLLPNLYGDILTDEAAQIQGGVGTAGSANMGDKYAMFEAIHGSAPRLIESGMGEYANPMSILKATALLLRHICRTEAAERLETALENCPLRVEPDGSAATCRQYADALIGML
jgi:isocitrate dehydrogenase (NAD+)